MEITPSRMLRCRHLQRRLFATAKAAAIVGWGLFASTGFIGSAPDNFSDCL